MGKKKRNKLVEKLAALEHDQWVAWSKSLAENEQLSDERLERWSKLWIPYSELSEDAKDDDRKWAYKVLNEVASQLPMDLLKWWLLFMATLLTTLVISWMVVSICW